MTLFLQVSLVALEARETKELLTGGTPKLGLFLTVVASRIFAPGDLLVEAELDLEVGKEHVVQFLGDLCQVEVWRSADDAEIRRFVFFKALGAEIVKAGQEFGGGHLCVASVT